jgi:hypothetical protein
MVCSRGFLYKNYITVIDDVSNERKTKSNSKLKCKMTSINVSHVLQQASNMSTYSKTKHKLTNEISIRCENKIK